MTDSESDAERSHFCRETTEDWDPIHQREVSHHPTQFDPTCPFAYDQKNCEPKLICVNQNSAFYAFCTVSNTINTRGKKWKISANEVIGNNFTIPPTTTDITDDDIVIVKDVPCTGYAPGKCVTLKVKKVVTALKCINEVPNKSDVDNDHGDYVRRIMNYEVLFGNMETHKQLCRVRPLQLSDLTPTQKLVVFARMLQCPNCLLCVWKTCSIGLKEELWKTQSNRLEKLIGDFYDGFNSSCTKPQRIAELDILNSLGPVQMGLSQDAIRIAFSYDSLPPVIQDQFRPMMDVFEIRANELELGGNVNGNPNELNIEEMEEDINNEKPEEEGGENNVVLDRETGNGKTEENENENPGAQVTVEMEHENQSNSIVSRLGMMQEYEEVDMSNSDAMKPGNTSDPTVANMEVMEEDRDCVEIEPPKCETSERVPEVVQVETEDQLNLTNLNWENNLIQCRVCNCYFNKNSMTETPTNPKVLQKWIGVLGSDFLGNIIDNSPPYFICLIHLRSIVDKVFEEE